MQGDIDCGGGVFPAASVRDRDVCDGGISEVGHGDTIAHSGSGGVPGGACQLHTQKPQRGRQRRRQGRVARVQQQDVAGEEAQGGRRGGWRWWWW